MASANASNPWDEHQPILEVPENNVQLEKSEPEATGAEEEELDDDDEFTYPGTGDYSTQMDELFDGEDDRDEDMGPKMKFGDDEEVEEDDDDEDGFMYEGVDADASISYKEQLRDVLGQDHEESEEDDADEVLEVERSLIYENGRGSSPLQPAEDENSHLNDSFLDRNSDVSSIRAISPGSRVSSPDPKLYPFKIARPFLHPTVSRLRSFTPQSSRAPSYNDSVASHSRLFDGASPAPSHFSSISRQSSNSNLQSSPVKSNGPTAQDNSQREQEVFKWTELLGVSQQIFSKASQKASSMLGAPLLGSPTVLAANGLICVGTSEGKVVVYDFNQTLLCFCDSNISGNTIGAVTAVALSHDHTFVASGHSTGYIQLYNLKNPRNPVRSVPPTTLAIVATGRKEGHIQGSRIVSLGFVAGRHTALVSADDHGLAFFHSLGKVLFVDATDILRILGRYDTPDRGSFSQSLKTPLVSSSVPTFSPTAADISMHRRRTRYTVLSMAPLPLGTAPHPTDTYHVVALLTPTKLVVVGLRPTPRTWFKCPREVDEGGSWRSRSKWIGALAWFPSVLTSSTTGEAKPTNSNTNGKKTGLEVVDPPTSPMLAFSWGSALHILKVMEVRIKQRVKNSKTEIVNEVDIGTVGFETFGRWSAADDILALQWLNSNQIVLVTRGELGVYDLRLDRLVEQVRFDGLSLNVPGANGVVDPENDLVAHSLRVYKGKLFLLKRDKMVVGTLLTWADRILSLVEEGDFLKAIELTRLYYTEEAPGNRNNLPLDPTQRKQIIGERMYGLMEASAQYAFSDERMTDETHRTPDGRGVDRTSLFEGIVATCCRASIALNNFDFLFEDLFQKYDDCGISSIYLSQLEPFVLDNQIRYVPPRITQRLVALHEQEQRPDLVERIIWHMDPSCLDINQAIQFCQHFQLYDALIYVYTRALRNYVAPVVGLLGLIRKVQRFRRERDDVRRRTGRVLDADSAMESIIMNAYKIFPYLANTLSGLTYPSEEPLPVEEAFQAKKDVYTFLFFGRSSVWPPGDGGKLILTSDEEGGVEPTYPYARLLLLFDAEAFLHSLDIGFEDAYLNDESQPINRLIIVRIILEILSSGQLPQDDITMVNIFIARNVPKYPQFLQQSPNALHNILIGLAEDPDSSTREDRQLAAEFLLSVYNPHDSEGVITLFEQAGFYRILRSWHYHDKRWDKLLSAYIVDPDVTSLELLKKAEEVISQSSRSNKGKIPADLTTIVVESLPRLLHANISATAQLIDNLIPDLHISALAAADSDHVRYEYLRTLLAPQTIEEDNSLGLRPSNPSNHVPPELYQTFFSLQCDFHPENVISTLQHLPRDTLKVDSILETCESKGNLDAAIWITNWRGEPLAALGKGATFQKQIVQKVLEAFVKESNDVNAIEAVRSLQSMAHISVDLCMEHSQGQAATETPLEDMWFQLLNSQINGVQLVAETLPSPPLDTSDPRVEELQELLTSMRVLVQTTFAALVSITSTSAVSFPRLFKRLVNSVPSSTGSHYTEFRMILTGMLESYRSDEDLLFMLKHLIERDLFQAVAEMNKERAHGWTAGMGVCQYCRKTLLSHKLKAAEGASPTFQVIVSRTGIISHSHCQPPEVISSA
ncbi:Golgi CORVET complex core vacuolar protein 8-domain-containing protein [Crepidotus variabilis]|uniref:Golgi CORVET complex core vacuolar protein 8-domain-containing protein n=1 Tax=Crepidotus variabilis TaxID=179855 RepID=A0A9P6EHU8_9AGAR|nr:Golgi CORVET complex core vacuolar protein 8-domain-containing protein [Crepidotus variabilis]